MKKKRIEGVAVPKTKGKRMIYGVKVWSMKKADLEFSKWIREQRNYTCENCGRYEEPPTWNIQTSHYIGRKHKALRYDVSNVDVLCSTCHANWEGQKQYGYRDFKIKQIGEKAHNDLLIKSRNSLGEKDAIYNCMILLGVIHTLSIDY